jgi:localization factor PodJL
VRAMHNLAVMLAEGGSAKPDYGKAVTWFSKAASYGVRDSQFNLAVLLARGLGVPQNLNQSYAWFALAAQQGDADAAKKRDAVAAKLDAKTLADAKATATSFKMLSPEPSANDVAPPPGGWGAVAPTHTASR